MGEPQAVRPRVVKEPLEVDPLWPLEIKDMLWLGPVDGSSVSSSHKQPLQHQIAETCLMEDGAQAYARGQELK